MKILATSLALAAVLALGACGDDSTDTGSGSNGTDPTTATTTTVAGGIETTAAMTDEAVSTVTVVDSEFGQILADGEGYTLYLFTPDTATTSACSGDCLAAWPPLVGPATGEGVGEDLATLTRDDGSLQVVFRGHPLYRFASDGPGDTSGQGVGGKWYVVTPDGSPVNADGTEDAKDGY